MNLALKEYEIFKFELSDSMKIDEIALLKTMNSLNWELAEFVLSRYVRRCMQISAAEFVRWKAKETSKTISKIVGYKVSFEKFKKHF